jgi:hypothetical protein
MLMKLAENIMDTKLPFKYFAVTIIFLIILVILILVLSSFENPPETEEVESSVLRDCGLTVSVDTETLNRGDGLALWTTVYQQSEDTSFYVECIVHDIERGWECECSQLP